VHSDPADVGVQQFTLAGVDAGADFNAKVLGFGMQRFSATDGLRPSNVMR
jgi:hypothetical protein